MLLSPDATDATREEIERAHIRLALAAEKGRVEAAARRLGIPRSTLYWKLKKFSIKPGDPVDVAEPPPSSVSNIRVS
jgi:transcriptional regulator of acetoin/glycerol metabolism